MKKLGGIGVWASIDNLKAHEAAAFAQSIEAWGYTAYWTPEAVGRDPFALLTFLAARTERLVLATGIANIYARDPMTTKAIHKTLSEMAPGRFVLGLGVSHEHLVKKVRGHEYEKPIPAHAFLPRSVVVGALHGSSRRGGCSDRSRCAPPGDAPRCP